jgi:DNA-binding CsgD family transcriptional regulator
VASLPLWDAEGYRLIVPPLQLARDVGELDQLPMLLNVLAVATALRGDLAGAASLVAEADAAREATGARLVAYAAMVLAAFRGSEAEAVPLIDATLEQAEAVGQGAAVTWAHWVSAVLHNGLGRYQEALAAARQAAGHKLLHLSMWALPELVEAAARTGNTGLAGDALDQLSDGTQAGRTDWGLGVEARCRALLSDGEAADRLYRKAIDRLGRTGMRPELARAHLLYGEWLRRQRRSVDAREQLRTAGQLLEAIGMEAFADRARRELLAAGGTARRRAATAKVELTAQEAQIARLAADGLSNQEIGVRLFLSPRTVQYHLGKVFAKLDVTSRNQLSRVLSGRLDPASPPAFRRSCC